MTPTDIADIQRQMAQIRHEMHDEVRSAVKSAQLITDWRALVKCHPLLSVAAASALGYLIVPRRRSETPKLVAIGPANHELRAVAASTDHQRKPGSIVWRVLGTAASLFAPIAIRAGQNYALGYLEKWLEAHPLPPAGGGSPGGRAREESQSAGEAGGRLRDYA